MDDALSARQLPNGQTEVGVHIADVSHFVPKVATSQSTMLPCINVSTCTPSARTYHSVYCCYCLHVCLQGGVWSARKCMHLTSRILYGVQLCLWRFSTMQQPCTQIALHTYGLSSQEAASSQCPGTNNVSRPEALQRMLHSSQACYATVCVCKQVMCHGAEVMWQHGVV